MNTYLVTFVSLLGNGRSFRTADKVTIETIELWEESIHYEQFGYEMSDNLSLAVTGFFKLDTDEPL